MEENAKELDQSYYRKETLAVKNDHSRMLNLKKKTCCVFMQTLEVSKGGARGIDPLYMIFMTPLKLKFSPPTRGWFFDPFANKSGLSADNFFLYKILEVHF